MSLHQHELKFENVEVLTFLDHVSVKTLGLSLSPTPVYPVRPSSYAAGKRYASRLHRAATIRVLVMFV